MNTLDDSFSQENGFGIHKKSAIRILKQTIDILNDLNIDYFLISGTLLGYVRHQDFIPWDDDIDLVVDESILDKLETIKKNYKVNIFYKSKYSSIKICFPDEIEIPENEQVKSWKDCAITDDNRYCWPFVDLFIYENGPGIHSCGDYVEINIGGKNVKTLRPFRGHCKNSFRFFGEKYISFFHNEWEKIEFFPLKSVDFLGLEVKVPKNPNYFLTHNYGLDYMTEYKPSKKSHKTETDII